jgi:glycosyltransferase involved in cell wall biosynthesis
MIIPPEKIRVLHLTNDSRIAGAETMILSLFEHYDREAFDFRLLTLFGPGELTKRSISLGVPAKQLEWNRALSFGAFYRLIKEIRTFRPHIIQSYLFHSNLIGRLAATLCRVPVMISGQRTFLEDSEQGRSQRKWDRRTFFMTDYCLANSIAGADSLFDQSEKQRQQISVVYNGIMTERFGLLEDNQRIELRKELGLDPDRFTFGMVAQLRRHKDHTTLIKAMAQLPQAQLLLVGSGDMEESIRKQIADCGLADRVIMAGYRSDIPRVLGALDAFVLATEIEGLPVSAMEAMATGLPVIATRVGGVPEIVLDGQTGILFEMNNVEQLHAALAELSTDVNKSKAMGRTGRQRIQEHFTPKRMAREFEDFYRKVTSE